jgi:hypothetical protein
VRYLIRSSVALEYFIPEEKMPVRMREAAELELSLPPYCGESRMYLGRAVTSRPSSFAIEEKP